MSSSKLFLDQNTFDDRWKVLDPAGFCYGDGETPEQAIKSARIVTDAPIYANSQFKGIINTVPDFGVIWPEDLTEDDTIYSKDDLIEVLAELSGFRIRKALDERHNVLGYTMELIE